MADKNVDPYSMALLGLQAARLFFIFTESTKEMTEEEKAAFWAKVTDRSALARELWERT
jgi:hypothetical protein